MTDEAIKADKEYYEARPDTEIIGRITMLREEEKFLTTILQERRTALNTFLDPTTYNVLPGPGGTTFYYPRQNAPVAEGNGPVVADKAVIKTSPPVTGSYPDLATKTPRQLQGIYMSKLNALKYAHHKTQVRLEKKTNGVYSALDLADSFPKK